MTFEKRLSGLEEENSRLRKALQKTIAAVEVSLTDEKEIKSFSENELRARIDRLESKLENLRKALSIVIDTMEENK